MEQILNTVHRTIRPGSVIVITTKQGEYDQRLSDGTPIRKGCRFHCFELQGTNQCRVKGLRVYCRWEGGWRDLQTLELS